MSNILDLAIAITLKDQITSSVNSIIGQFRLMENAADDVQKKMDRFSTMTWTGGALALGGVAAFSAISGAIVETTKQAMEFEDVMNKVKVAAFGKDLLDVSKAQEVKQTLADLQEGFEKLGMATTFTDKSVGEAALGMLRGGLSKEFLLGEKDKDGKYNYSGLAAAVYSAQLGDVDPMVAGDFIAKQKAAFNMTGNRALEATNFYAKTSAASTMDYQQLISGMLTASGVGGTLGLSPEDTALLVATTGTYTKDGGAAGTFTKDFLDRLIPHTKKQKETMMELGWLKKGEERSIFFNEDGTIKSADFLFKTFQEAREKFAPDEFQNMMHKVFLEQGKNTALALANESDVYKQIKDNINNQLDMYQQVEVIMSGGKNMLDSLQETWTITKRIFGDPFLEPAKKMITEFKDILEDFIQPWAKAHPDMIRTIGIVGLVGSAFMILSGLVLASVGAFGMLTIAMSAAGITFTGVAATAGGFLLVAAAIAGIAYLIYQNWDTVKNLWEEYGWVVRGVAGIFLVAYTPAIILATANLLRLAAITTYTAIQTALLRAWTAASAFVMGAYRSVVLAVTLAKWMYAVSTGAATLATRGQMLAVMLLAPWIATVRLAVMTWTGAQWLLNAALTANPIGAVIMIIVALVAAVALVIYYWRDWWNALKNFADNVPGWAAALLSAFAPVIGIPITIAKYWDTAIAKVKEFLGLEPEKKEIPAPKMPDFSNVPGLNNGLKIPATVDTSKIPQQLMQLGLPQSNLKIPVNLDTKHVNEQMTQLNQQMTNNPVNATGIQIPANLNTEELMKQVNAMAQPGAGGMPPIEMPANLNTEELMKQINAMAQPGAIPQMQIPAGLDTEKLQKEMATLNKQVMTPKKVEVISKLNWEHVKQQTPLLQKHMNTAGKTAGTDFAKGITSVYGVIGNAISGIRGVITSNLPTAESMRKYGSNLVDSFADGLLSKVSAVRSASQQIAAAAHANLGVQSPTKEGPLRTNHLWGGNLATSLAKGMLSRISEVRSASATIADAMTVKGRYSLEGDVQNPNAVIHPGRRISAQEVAEGTGDITVNGPLIGAIYQQPGENTEAFAQRVAQILERNQNKKSVQSNLTIGLGPIAPGVI
ncbi:phage tail tape measure protein [Aneurinibacillus aneurinilyticus]|uniref:phage tail tape measure protein n=1 Tax=Aneurinibacillus aneurinilyticus TaxID=1391 RepID=UPI002E21A747|nr:phage tail tape measure protein [Aneurinibacillus aneurinilyticus]MED0672105.1 phage tail tape measure protein [Aneurinibacillus aneurinilyticus]